jgi:lysophospholipase L1-like esterase
VRNWPLFLAHVSQYAACDSCHALFLNHVKHVVTRTNRYTGKKYIDDSAIMSWQVGNEPRVFSNEGKPAFIRWLKEVTKLIRSLDPNHLISLGNEGAMGCEGDMQLFETIHADPNVDYLTIHIWPKNWSWISIPDVTDHIAAAIEKTNAYIEAHTAIAEKLQKPLVIEEFGYPRDHHRYTLDDPTTARDTYYRNIFAQVTASAESAGMLAGCNFWTWGGFGRTAHEYWLPWDDYLGDPAQEEQGLNSVFDVDATIGLIKKYANRLTPAKAAFMGYSISLMWADMRPGFFKDNHYVGCGIGGQTTPQMLSRFRLDIVTLKPQVAVINGGINDIACNSGDYDFELTLASIRSMAEIAHANGIKVILTSVLPAAEIPWRKEITSVPEKVDRLNAAIKAYCAKKGFTYVDYYAQLVRKDGVKGMLEQYTTDGVHVTVAGYEVMEEIIKQTIDNIIKK